MRNANGSNYLHYSGLNPCLLHMTYILYYIKLLKVKERKAHFTWHCSKAVLQTREITQYISSVRVCLLEQQLCKCQTEIAFIGITCPYLKTFKSMHVHRTPE